MRRVSVEESSFFIIHREGGGGKARETRKRTQLTVGVARHTRRGRALWHRRIKAHTRGTALNKRANYCARRTNSCAFDVEAVCFVTYICIVLKWIRAAVALVQITRHDRDVTLALRC